MKSTVMNSSNTGFDVAIGPCRFLMRAMGIYPDPLIKRTWIDLVKFLVAVAIVLIFCNISQSLTVVKVWGDLNEVIEVLTTMDLPTGCAFFKFIGLRYNGYGMYTHLMVEFLKKMQVLHFEVLSPLILSMMNDWKLPNTKEQLQIMWKNAKLSRLMSITIISLAEGTCVTYIITLVLYTRSDYSRQRLMMEESNLTEIFRKTFFKAEFFYDTQKTPMYEITWIFQCISMFLAASSFSSVDALFAVLVLHFCSQLNIMRNDIKLLPLSLRSDWTGESYIKLLARIIEKHIFLEKYAKSIEDAFNVMFLVQMIVCTIVICLQGYEIVSISTRGGGLSFFELIYMLYSILCFMFSLFVYCYVAELLRTECMEVGDVVYEIDWYTFSVKNAMPLILIMVRAKHPFNITAGKFVDFSLELYCSILKTSGGYLSMLLAIKDRIE